MFTNRTPAEKTPEQKKIANAAWKPSKTRLAMQQSGEAVTVYRSPEAQAAYDAKVAAAAAEKAARKAAGIAKRAATLAAKKAAKTKAKKV